MINFLVFVSGLIALLWCIAWFTLSSRKPENHPFISKNEKQYIISHRAGLKSSTQGETKKPYRAMLKSVPLYAFIFSLACHGWSVTVIVSYLPMFYTTIMRFTVPQVGTLMALSFAAQFLGTFLWTAIGNKMATMLGINRSRKLCTSIGFSLSGVFQLIVAFLGENEKWLVAVLVLCMIMNHSVATSILHTFPLHMGPRFTGFIFGVTASISGLISTSGPLIFSAVTANGTPEEWTTVWIIASVAYFAPAIIVILFGQASLQPWAQEDTDSSIEGEK